MDRIIVNVPWSVMCLTTRDWDIDWRAQRHGESLTGVSQSVYSAFPRWIGSPQAVLTGARLLQWRAIRWQGKGLQAVYRVYMRDPAAVVRARLAEADGVDAATGVPFSNDELFVGDVGFDYRPFVLAAEAAAAGATSVLVDASAYPGAVVQGMILSHKDWPFGVTSVTEDGGNLRLEVRPGLRAAIAEGDSVHLIPTGLFEASEEGMGNPAYGQFAKTSVQLQLREWLGPGR